MLSEFKNGATGWVDVREGILTKDGKEIFGNMQEGVTILARDSEEIKQGLWISFIVLQKTWI